MCKEREGPGQSPGETARRRGAAVLRDSVAASRPRGLELLLLLGVEPVKPEEGVIAGEPAHVLGATTIILCRDRGEEHQDMDQ